jgi:hypothetical protein
MHEIPDYLKNIHKHQEASDSIAREALKKVSKDIKVPYAKTVKLFTNGDYEITLKFWKLVNAIDDKYTGVEYCSCCRKFDLSTE